MATNFFRSKLFAVSAAVDVTVYYICVISVFFFLFVCFIWFFYYYTFVFFFLCGQLNGIKTTESLAVSSI